MKSYNILLAATLLIASSTSSVAQEQQDSTIKENDMKYIGNINVDSISSLFNKRKKQMDYIASDDRTDDIWKHRGTYLNLSWVEQEFSSEQPLTLSDGTSIGSPVWKSTWGAGFSWGRQFYICPTKPIAKLFEFAIDYTWIEANVVQYDYPTDFRSQGTASKPSWSTATRKSSFLDTDKLKMMQVDLGMSIGASLTFNPCGQLKIGGYYHFTPTYSMMLIDGNMSGTYASFMSIGAAISYHAFSIGWETRWGTGKYCEFFNAKDYQGWKNNLGTDTKITATDLDALGAVMSSDEKFEYKTTSTRLYIGFRF